MPVIVESIEPSNNDTALEKESNVIAQPIFLPPPQRKSKVQKINGMWIGSKRNNIKVASKKRITKLINLQFDQNKEALLNNPMAKPSYKTPQAKYECHFFAPNPKGSGMQPAPITQDNNEEDDEENIQQSQRIWKQQPIWMQ